MFETPGLALVSNNQKMSCNNANNNTDEMCELEDQFILRLPQKQAKLVRKLLRNKPKKLKKHVSIQLDDDLQHGIVKVHKKFLHAHLLSLPTIIESSKTIDKVHLFKTADVCQILVCQEEEMRGLSLSPHGYTPPMKNARKFRLRKTLHNNSDDDIKEIADIEKEVLWLLRMDNEAVSTKFELVPDCKANKGAAEVNELLLFGEKISDLESDKESASGSASSCDVMDFTN